MLATNILEQLLNPGVVWISIPLAGIALAGIIVISSMIIKSSLGLSFGVVFSVLLFKRRAWPAWVGLGFGAGRAWEEADSTLDILSAPGQPWKLSGFLWDRLSPAKINELTVPI